MYSDKCQSSIFQLTPYHTQIPVAVANKNFTVTPSRYICGYSLGKLLSVTMWEPRILRWRLDMFEHLYIHWLGGWKSPGAGLDAAAVKFLLLLGIKARLLDNSVVTILSYISYDYKYVYDNSVMCVCVNAGMCMCICGKRKAIPLQAWIGPYGSWSLRLSGFLDANVVRLPTLSYDRF